MKRFPICYLILLLLWLPIKSSAQRVPVKIILKDGSVIKAMGKLNERRVKFWKSEDSKPQEMYITEVDYVQLQGSHGLETYRAVRVKNLEGQMIMKELIRGEVVLYSSNSKTMQTSASPVGAGGVPMMEVSSVIDYYVKREGEDAVEYLVSSQWLSRSFRKAGVEYFKDCPSLVKKIKDREYKRKHIKEAVTFYNKNCH